MVVLHCNSILSDFNNHDSNPPAYQIKYRTAAVDLINPFG